MVTIQHRKSSEVSLFGMGRGDFSPQLIVVDWDLENNAEEDPDSFWSQTVQHGSSTTSKGGNNNVRTPDLYGNRTPSTPGGGQGPGRPDTPDTSPTRKISPEAKEAFS